MTNYQYLKENNLYEAHKRFVRALGEGYGYAPIEEDDDENPMNPQDSQGQPDMGGMGAPQGGNDAAGGMPPMGGGMPQDDPSMGGADPSQGGMPPVGGDGVDPNAGGMPQGDPSQQGGAATPIDGEVDDDLGMDGTDTDAAGEGDDVIDVDDLTNAQEKVNDKVNSVGRDLGKVDGRIEKLLGAIEKLEGMFDRNNSEIADLRREFEKRNPTQTEKLNLRSLDSYPFNVRPTDYWADKGENSNYQAYADNSEPTTDEYQVTNSDVDDFSEREIADSFDIEDELNQDIRKIFGL